MISREEPGYNDIGLCDTSSITSYIVYSVVPISFSLLTCTLFSSVRTTVIYNATKTPASKLHIQKCSLYARPVCAIRKPHLTHAHAPSDTAYWKVNLIRPFFSETAVNGDSDLDKQTVCDYTVTICNFLPTRRLTDSILNIVRNHPKHTMNGG